jgi:hypothetical protein
MARDRSEVAEMLGGRLKMLARTTVGEKDLQPKDFRL